MPKILKVTIVNGDRHDLTEYSGKQVADVDHFKLDLLAYLRRYRGSRQKIELNIEWKEGKI